MSRKFGVLLLGVGIAWGGGLFVVLDGYCADAYIAQGHRALVEDRGIMSMDLGELNAYFRDNVSYQWDSEFDSWKPPSQFVADGGGDCEDYVLFALAVLDHEVYELRPISGSYNGIGHFFMTATDPEGRVFLVDTAGVNLLPDGQLPEGFAVEQTYDDMLTEVLA